MILFPLPHKPLRMRLSQKRGSAFSVIELLIAIAVVAVLTALMIAGVGSWSERTASSKCVYNLRQIGLLMNGYAGEHNGYYPYEAYIRGYKGGGMGYAPEHYMLDYAGFAKESDGRIIQDAAPAPRSLFHCPAEKSERDMNGNLWFQSHYAFNQYLVHYVITTPEQQTAMGTNRCRRPITTISNPSQIFLAADTRLRYNISAESPNVKLAFRHGDPGACNMLFVDGHVEVLPASAKDMIGGPAALGWGQYIEWGGERRAPKSPRY